MSWDRIRGHDTVRNRFETAHASRRLGQAYLFLGQEGIGKKLFAVEFAKALLCESPNTTLRACDRCPACLLVDAGTHPDLTIVGKPEDKTELPIATIRELTNHLGLKATRGLRKVAIIDDADAFNEESSNAFLKTLEEPAPGTMLILIGTSADVQLPTILSRCQLVRFNRLTTDDVMQILSSQGIAPNDADRLARQANGSPGKAFEMNDSALWEFRGVMTAAVAATPFRRTGLLESWLRFIEEAGKDAPAQRRRARLSLDLLLDFLTKSMRLAVESGTASVASQDRDLTKALADKVGPDRLLSAIDTVRQADDRIDRRVPVAISLEAMVDQLGPVLNPL